MITADDFFDAAGAAGLDFFSGVPCSLVAPLIERAEMRSDIQYVGAVNEGDAVAVALGAWLGGRASGMMCQNSGLANAINPLASLVLPFRAPMMLVVTHRGAPGKPDEPQHEVMGKITQQLLGLLGMESRAFPTNCQELASVIDAFQGAYAARRPLSLVVSPGTFQSSISAERPTTTRAALPTVWRDESGTRTSRAAILQTLLQIAPPDAAIVSTTGMCSRELFTLGDGARNFYVIGGMGCTLPIGLGVAMNYSGTTIVLDGDGAALMRLGTWATVGAYAPFNLLHVILDNGVHDSTGGQATVSPVVDFPGIALSCGYGYAASCDSVEGFEHAFKAALASRKPALVRVGIQRGSMAKLGRPTISPEDVALRFKDFLRSGLLAPI